MTIHVLTLFPDITNAYFESSIMARAIKKGLISCHSVNIRDFAQDKHRSCDDVTYGGGAGMVLLPEPLGRALDSIHAEKKRVIYPCPAGKPLTQRFAAELAQEESLVFIAGRYEGIDRRIIDMYVNDEISIGDYVLSSGELSSLVIIDAVYRLITGVISKNSLDEESFSDGLLEYPQYTRPQIYRGLEVPPILLSGHHEEIRKWRLKKRIEYTRRVRPDLLADARKSYSWSTEAENMLREIEDEGRFNTKN